MAMRSLVLVFLIGMALLLATAMASAGHPEKPQEVKPKEMQVHYAKPDQFGPYGGYGPGYGYGYGRRGGFWGRRGRFGRGRWRSGRYCCRFHRGYCFDWC